MSSIMREDWIECELGEICFTTSGGTPSRNNIEFYQGSIPWVKSGELDKGIIYDTEEHISDDAVKKSSTKIFPEGSLLIALYGATIGKLAFLGVEATTNQAICGILKNEFIDSKYLYNFLLNRKQKLISQGTGGAQPNISQTILKKLEIPLAPLPIQRALVSKIEALFSDLDNGIANFKKAQDQLKIYRQAVLKKAFEGKLSEPLIKNDFSDDTDFEIEKEKSNQSFNQKNHSSDNLPKGWKWVKLGEVANITSSKRIFQHDYVNEGIPFYRTKEIKELSEGKKLTFDLFISENKYNEIKTKFPIPKIGDILLSAVGTIGVSYVVKDEKSFYFKDGNLMWFKELNGINPYFLSYGLTSFIRHKNEAKTSGSAYSALTIETMKRFDFPLPPTLQEQTQIVQEIEFRLSVCDKVEQSITESIIKAEALRQSILKKAFEGRLLSEAEIELCKQAADYEPASELLKKIKAEKLAKEQEQKKVTTKKKSKK